MYLLVLALEYWHFEHILYDICRIIVDFHFVQMPIVILCPLLLSSMCNNSLMRNIAGMCLVGQAQQKIVLTSSCTSAMSEKDHCNLKIIAI